MRLHHCFCSRSVAGRYSELFKLVASEKTRFTPTVPYVVSQCATDEKGTSDVGMQIDLFVLSVHEVSRQF